MALTGTLAFQYYLNQIKPEGHIVYEYNPLRNFRITKDTDSKGRHPGDTGFGEGDTDIIEAGSVVDLDTELLKFDLNHPVDIQVQKSYDGSDNLIINDNSNIPRLINSRFSVLPKNRYEIVDRIGNNDTNLYDDDQFDQDTSLYKRITNIPRIKLNSVSGSGRLKVGNYTLYIKYVDADGNETDFVAESGIISCFIGNNADPYSIQGGIRDENSNKAINITVTNIDPAYDYIKVYFTRATSEFDSPIITAHKINQNYYCLNSTSNIIITGDEDIEDIPLSEINSEYFIVDAAQAQAQCQNIFFMGNIHKPSIDYADLQDISLRILPTLSIEESADLIGKVDTDYNDNSRAQNSYEYYNVQNIYNYVGYWHDEIYRFGIVYIMNDFTLSPVFNIRGTLNIPTNLSKYGTLPPIWKDGERNMLNILEGTFTIQDRENDNSKGVIKTPRLSNSSNKIYGIKMNIPQEVLEYLKGKVKGLFFVRQKRIPTTLCQVVTLPMDTQSCLPLIKGTEGDWFIEGFLNESGSLVQHYSERLKKIVPKNNLFQYAGICPEYDVRHTYFNQLFTGTSYNLRGVFKNDISNSTYDERRYIIETNKTDNSNISGIAVIGVDDNTPIVTINDSKFRGRAGEAEEGYKFEYIEQENELKENYRIVRGAFGPYLGLVSSQLQPLITYDIKIPGFNESQMSQYFNTRYYDNSGYFPISDRISLEDIENSYAIDLYDSQSIYNTTCFRGDCYICTFTHRLNRNFQDPDAPINDQIVDPNTWKDNYELENKENLQKINRGDVNAIQLGSWITLKIKSTYNLNLRSLDHSNVSEESLTGFARGFFPLQYCSAIGPSKIPESQILNTGYSSSTGQKIYFNLPDVPYIKNRFDNRIIYSDIAVNDAFKNGFRVFQFNHYRDYPRVYGGLIKLVELQGSLLAVWEHGVGIIPVNERAVAGEGAGGNVFINTSNVLPENPKMLSDMYGSQWAESVLKTPYYVYGVDTVGKKIWRTNGSQFEIISDFKIQKFLNDNISLTERELEPIIGVRNVKTHYNAFKSDVMFTFYDNTIGFEEKVWNICYNEILQNWITFYSWVPSYSENIDNIYFSFNRDTSKWISKLGASSKNSNSADGIVLDSVVLEDWVDGSPLDIVNRARPNTENTGITEQLSFSLKRDIYGNYKLFSISNGKLYYNGPKNSDGSIDISSWKYPVLLLNIECYIDAQIDPDSLSKPIGQEEYIKGWNEYISINADIYQSTIAVTSQKILEASAKESLNLTTDFWKHGQSGIIDIKDKLKPCFWYGKQHPFEFECIVVDNPAVHKIFNNLQIISNKAKPESFHYEIVGECFNFAKDKKNLFIRQEATRDFYQYNGSDITYDRKFLELQGKQNKKSITMPNYYSRVDTINEIEDSYKQMTSPNKDYSNLSGSEIVYYDNLNEFRIWNHSKAVDIEEEGGRIRGNMNYQEDKWDIQINPIIIVEKNENPWNTSNGIPKVPITIGNSPIPEDFIGTQVTNDNIPEDLKDKGYTIQDIDISDWGVYPIGRDQEGNIIYADAGTRKEVKVKDKFVKIRVRYSGEDVAIITALKTIYNISYA